MTGLFSNPTRPQLLTVRCQIWHRSEHRQSYADNQDLAFILRFCSSHGWRVKAARLENGSYGNEFVPIEVDLQCTYNDLPLASASLREIFLGTAKFHVDDLFKNRESEPLYVNMYPIGSITSDDIRRGFTHFRALQSLDVQSHACAKRCPNTTQSIEAELARLGVEVPARTLGLLKLYVQVHLGNNPSAKDIKKCCKAVENSMDKGFLSEWRKDSLKDGPVVSEIETKENEELWDQSLVSFWHVEFLSTQIHGCIESLTAGRALSNQDLLDNLVYMQRASAHFSKYQMYIAKLTKLLLQVHGNSSSKADNMISSLIGAGLVSYIAGTNPLLFGFISLGALKGTFEYYWRSRKQSAVKDLGKAMGDFGQHLQKAQLALAAQFCKQMLKVRLDQLSIAERNDILKDLGVDVERLPFQRLDEGLVLAALIEFRTQYLAFESKRDQVRKDAGLSQFTMVDPIEDEAEE
ncbi:hypothetical protein MRS44_008265 [Fusarium solani]|uniref:uncharacterized protein n=1 Tax=Fusarium solani TaxID=169388 RepID=UPI0023161876|nr:hypothetical protein MRS44_008265 [Fusarium solani]KAJ4212425.1 hypothetical protein NW759_011812 [Fusarium solani]